MQKSATEAPFIDEPMIVPPTIGETLETASRVLGALALSDLPAVEATKVQELRDARNALISAIEADSAHEGSTLREVQKALSAFYQTVQDDEVACKVLGFQTAEYLSDLMNVGIVDVEKVITTFTIQDKQMLTSLSFPRAANAKFYWLHEVRYFEEDPSERVEDPILQSRLPLFDRVRLAPGKRILRIKTRNASGRAITKEFVVEVPQP